MAQGSMDYEFMVQAYGLKCRGFALAPYMKMRASSKGALEDKPLKPLKPLTPKPYLNLPNPTFLLGPYKLHIKVHK